MAIRCSPWGMHCAVPYYFSRASRLLYHHAQVVSKVSRPCAHPVILQMTTIFSKISVPMAISLTCGSRSLANRSVLNSIAVTVTIHFRIVLFLT